jgi:hypothetical protein
VKSIISNERACVVCGAENSLHRHHIYHGTANRKLSEKYGCWCYLCARHHNMSDQGVHSDNLLDLKLKKWCQEILEKDYGWTRQRMIKTFGRNYL